MRIDGAKILDPRHFQILALGILVGVQMFWADFGPEPLVVGMIAASAVTAQILFSYLFKVNLDIRGAFITSLSTSLLLKASVVWILPLAVFVAIASKFLLRIEGKHIFNPANFGIVVALLILPDVVWVSPGQWGTEVWLGLLMVCMAFMVLYRLERSDISIFFAFVWLGFLVSRSLWLGDPLSIPIHSIQNGAFLVFTFFMISDPMTSPDTRLGRLIFAFLIAILSFILQFEFQVRESFFYALAVACLARPMVDILFQGAKYKWHS